MTLPLPIVYVTEPLLAETARLLASFAAEEDSEGIVYWFGLEFGTKAIVTTLVVPEADTSGGRICTSPAANGAAVRVTVDTPLVLLGQAHSHPSRNVNHSWVDDRDTFAQFPGAISVVVPHLGRRGMDLVMCGVHRYLEGRFCRLRNRELAAHLRVLPGYVDLRPEFRLA
jgi:hypothetical protein